MRLLGSLLLVVAVVASCGGNGDDDRAAPGTIDAELAPYEEALRTQLTTSSDLPVGEAELRCFTADAITLIGLDRLSVYPSPEAFAAEDDLTALGLDDTEAGRLADALLACAPGLADAVRDDFATSTGVDVTDDQRACLDAVLDNDLVRSLIASSFVATSAGDVIQPVLVDLEACLS